MVNERGAADASVAAPRTYDVALSYASEDRRYVEEVARQLETAGIAVFYDRFHEWKAWGLNLYEYLQDVYANRARYCVMFLSKHYARERWTSHEREAAQSRALLERQEYILPARFDSTEVPGLNRTIAYIDLARREPAELVQIILKKLGQTTRRAPTSIRWRRHVVGASLLSLLLAAALLGTLRSNRPQRPRPPVWMTGDAVPALRELTRLADDLAIAAGHYTAWRPAGEIDMEQQIQDLGAAVARYNDAFELLRAKTEAVQSGLSSLRKSDADLEHALSAAFSYARGNFQPFPLPTKDSRITVEQQHQQLVPIWRANETELKSNVSRLRSMVNDLEAQVFTSAGVPAPECAN